MFENLRADTQRLRAIKEKGYPWYVIESLLFENGYQAVVLYRMAHGFKKRRWPFMGPLLMRLSQFLTGVEIAPGAEIGPGLMISHGMGIVIGESARIGKNATLHQQVTLGARGLGTIEEMPRLGDDVFIAAGARLLGGIEVGDGAFIGANAVVAKDVPAGYKALSAAGLTLSPPPDNPDES